MADTILFHTTITAIGAEAGDLIDGGVLILFDSSAPPELAEVSVIHENAHPVGRAPAGGDVLLIGAERFRITAVGGSAWRKVGDIGHVVFSFNGAETAERPGEICLEPASPEVVRGALAPGAGTRDQQPALKGTRSCWCNDTPW